MRHTSGLALTIAAVLGGVLGWALQGLLVFSGNPALTPPLTWGVALGALGALILALAWPIRSQVRGETKKPPVDPFYATRVVLLAQAGSRAGSALCGVWVGFVIYLISPPVVTADILWPSALECAGALVLGVSGLIAERWCTLPPDSSEGGALGVPEGEVS
jgi:hypothetical protein